MTQNHTKKRFSLAYRFVALFIVVALAPLTLFGYLSMRQHETELRNEILNRMSRLADKKTLQIKTYLAERIQDVEFMARGKLVEISLSEVSNAYVRYGAGSMEYENVAGQFNENFGAYTGEGEKKLFYDVFLITPQGEIIYTYRRESDFATNLINGPYKDSPLGLVFRESNMIMESSISDFELYGPSNAPAAFVSAPILRNGVLLGVVAFQLDTQSIYEVTMDNTGLGATGETELAKLTSPDEALFVAPLRRDPQAALKRRINLAKTAVPMRHALAGERGNGITSDYSGTPIAAAWRYLPELRWGMVIKMDVEEVFAPVYRKQRHLFAALLALAFFGGFVAYYYGRQMVARLRKFARNADEIAKGDLTKRVEEAGKDEIGALARSFNSMTGNLQSLYRTLEERIEERTHELRHNQDLLNEAQLLGKLGSWELNLITGELRWSDEIYRIFELNPADFSPSYENFLNVIHPDDREKVKQAYDQSLKDRQPYNVVHRLLLSDGRIKWVHEHCRSYFDESGKPLRSIGAVQDITTQKLAEESLRIAAVTFETHEAILITDANANIIRVNQAFTDITGYKQEEVLNKNPRFLRSGYHEKDFYREMWKVLLETGSWTGEMWDRRKDGHVYPKWLTITAIRNEKGEITQYVGIFSDITERKKAEEEIQNLAFYDPLTKLPNRRLMLDRFGLALSLSARSLHYGAVLFLDMDKFKTLNDTMGHAYGDLMLIEVAARIKSTVREVDTVARLGGDEFVILIEEISLDYEEASQKVALVAEKVRSELALPYKLKMYEHHSSPSIGVCMYLGNEETVDALLKHADMAMYQAKDAGRNAVRFFDPVMQRAVETHAMLEADLRHAIPEKQLRLYYQIQVDSNNRPLGAEVLVRWIHPKRGMVLPAQFIPVLEESSLILDVGHWVLETACRQLARWSKEERTRGLLLAVNVSAKQFRKHDFVDNVANMIREYHINPSNLKLELTESLVLTDVREVVEKMKLLNTMGVKLSMDDFGTGYSSLSYLKHLPVHQIKIDQSFMRDITTVPDDAMMVQTIVNMARNFGLDVIAEGVETEAQRDFLKKLGCEEYQGYLFGKPMPIDEFESLLGKFP